MGGLGRGFLWPIGLISPISSIRSRNRLIINYLSAALQKAVFCIVKGALLACDSWPFALRFAAFYKSVGRAALPIPSANIVKGECKAKQKTKFFKFAFPGRILYSRSRYNERLEQRQSKDEVFMQKNPVCQSGIRDFYFIHRLSLPVISSVLLRLFHQPCARC